MNVVLVVEELEPCDYLFQHVERLFGSEGLLAEGLPLADWIWCLHFDKEEVVGDDPVLLDGDQVLVLEARQSLNHLDGTTSLLLIQG